MLEQEDDVVGLEEVYDIFEEFGGEDEYWRLIKEPLIDGITIRQYLDSLKKEFADSKGMLENDVELLNEWDKQEQKIREEALNEAKGRIKKDKCKKLIKQVLSE